MSKIDVDDDVHSAVKAYCKMHGSTVKSFASKVLLDAVRGHYVPREEAVVQKKSLVLDSSSESSDGVYSQPPFWETRSNPNGKDQT